MTPSSDEIPTPDQRPVLAQLNVVSANVAASVEFYRLFGLDIPETAPGWDAHHRSAHFEDSADIDLDIDSTAFATKWGSEDLPVGPLISFRVASREAVDGLHDKLTAAGHRSLRAPYDAFWGIRYAIIEDPGGTPVGIMSAPSEEHRSAPPDVSAFESPKFRDPHPEPTTASSQTPSPPAAPPTPRELVPT